MPLRLLESNCGLVTLTVTQDGLGSAKYRTWHEGDLMEGPTGHGKDLDFVLNNGGGILDSLIIGSGMI